MNLDKRIQAFVQLGNFILENPIELQEVIQKTYVYNTWFTKENTLQALQNIAFEFLNEEKLRNWISTYHLPNSIYHSNTIAIVAAGNIPMVGFHDLVCVLISGHHALVKRSSNDQQLIKFMVDYLIALDNRFAERITIIDGKLENFDAVIATGSNNTARYFEYYFGNKPNIIRKNRNSVEILNGNESHDDLVKLGEDIFRYFGLGCRNVSKLFVPENYDFQLFFQAIYEYKDVIFYEKYSNNYDYNKAVFLMSNFKLLDNEFLTLKEDTSYSSPISSVFYEYYDDLELLKQHLKNDSEKIQCIVSNDLIENSITFGETQKPHLWDYADNVDTLQFLMKL